MRFTKTIKIIQEYTEHSTIQGIDSIFASRQTRFSMIFWSVTVLSMLSLGINWSFKMYTDWNSYPVLTTITTTGQSVKVVEFPSVTICTPGNSKLVTTAKLLTQFKNYLTYDLQLPNNLDPLHLANYMIKVIFTNH